MSDPVLVCVAVILKEKDERFDWKKRKEMTEEGKNPPTFICYGYEDNNAHGAGQDTDWQNTSWNDKAPKYGDEGYDEWHEENTRHIYGYEIASTWNGVIVFNGALHKAIEEKTKELRKWFPDTEIENFHTIVRGKQN